MSRQKSVLTAISGVDTAIAGGMPTSFARHEPAAVQAARRAFRFGRRTRLERWTRGAGAEGIRGPEARARPTSGAASTRRTGGGPRQRALRRGGVRPAGWLELILAPHDTLIHRP